VVGSRLAWSPPGRCRPRTVPRVTLRVVVLLLAMAFVFWRFLPRYRMPWTIPLVLVGVVLTVRTVTWLAGD
jgi:hypothetical protein